MSEFEQSLSWASQFSVDYLKEVGKQRVVPQVKPGEISASLPASAPEESEPMSAILADFERLILPGITHWQHPGFLNFFSCSTSEPGIVAEMLSATLNANGMLWKTSPAITELEQTTLDWLRQWMGLGHGWFGMFHDTASTATLHAMIAARQRIAPEARAEGLRGDLVIYASEWAHSSIEKDVFVAGFGTNQLRKIETDPVTLAMKPEALKIAIEKDRAAGLRPCCIVATVGTTSTTAIDPVAEIGNIARAENIWLHVDAAYGGALAVAEEFRWLMDGVEAADSLVVNPHKWLFVPFDCSAFFCKQPEVLRQAFSLVPSYLQTNDETVNLMDYGIPLGRKFRALKLWFVMRNFGRQRIVSILRDHMKWIAWLADKLCNDQRFEVTHPVTMGLVCYRLRAGDAATLSLVDRINASGRFFIGTAQVQGRPIIRTALGNLSVCRETIEQFWQLLNAEA
jgi:aromatic-L-amino-acid/L-tryptophan decarboxylase